MQMKLYLMPNAVSMERWEIGFLLFFRIFDNNIMLGNSLIMFKSKRFRLRRNWMVKISIFLLPLNRINFLQHWLLSQRMAQWKSRCRTGQLALEWSCDPNWLVIKNYKRNYNKSMQNYFLIIQRIFNRLYFIYSSRYP